MSMSMHAIGFKPPDDKWKKMKAVWDACDAGGISVPEEVKKFFNWKKPDENGVEVSLPMRQWEDEGQQGFELDVSALDKGIKVIRFYCSW